MERRDSTAAVPIASVSAAVVDPPDSNQSKDCDNLSDEYKVRRYPFAVVLRIRVLQVVCGISSMVMGTVGFIEEKGEINLGLGIPAGAATVIAAGASIHTTRGFGGYKPSSCNPGTWLSKLRFLGPSVGVASALTSVWTTAFLLHLVLAGLAGRSVIQEHWIVIQDEGGFSSSVAIDDDWNGRAMAAIILVLSATTLLSVLVLLRVDCLYDPD